jgi:hypothetical protein
MRRSGALLVSLCIATSLAGAQVSPGERTEGSARALFERGVAAADEARWAEAAEAFERSYAIAPRPATLRNLGLADRARGRYTRAISELERFLAAGRPAPTMARELRRMVDEMRQRLATLSFEVAPANTSLLVDGATALADAPLTLDPGEHTVLASAPGHARTAQVLTLGGGERRTLRVSLARDGSDDAIAAPGAARNDGGVLTRWWFWTAVGVAVAGGVAASVMLLSNDEAPNCGTLGACITLP